MSFFTADELPESLSWVPDAWNRQLEEIATLKDELHEHDDTLARALKRLGELIEKIERLENELDHWHESCHAMERERDSYKELLHIAICDLAPYLDFDNYTEILRKRITK